MINLFRRRPKSIKVNTGKFIEVTHPHLRPNSTIPQQEIYIAYNYAGLGDYIHWVTAVSWVIEQHTHLTGKILAPKFFYELANHWHQKHKPRFEVVKYDDIKTDKIFREHKYYIMPDQHQLMNSMGGHLLPVGFHYYGNIDTIPPGYEKIPEIEGDEVDVTKFNLPKKYAVITTEATSPVRKFKSEAINELTIYCNQKGITPVFLGKHELTADYRSQSPTNINTEDVIDLREKTTLLEAAVILANAQFVLGVDNGLLHLASTTRVPVVFGFTTVEPRHRTPPRRPNTKTISVVPPEKLNCRFCQSRVRHVLGHDFRNCLYDKTNKNVACLDYMNASAFIKAIEKVYQMD